MTTPERSVEEYFPEELRMRAYCYGFKPTGDRSIDEILSAVAIAGKAFHSTDQWQDELYGENITPEQLIQYAADKATKTLQAERQKRDEMVGHAEAREKQLKTIHTMELDTVSCMSIEDFVVWRDNRKQRPTQPNNPNPHESK